ncbi:pilus assembly protein [Acidobacteria bacterium AB60]|nr:pilus assembly protein [Acidobacteria bacterium AB60]
MKWKQVLWGRLWREDGVNAVEMALSSMVLFAMLIGICQVSLGLYAYQYCSDAARLASRYAMVRGNTSCTNTPSLSKCNASATDISNYVKGLGYKGITSSNVTVTTSWCAAGTSTPMTWASCSSGTAKAPGNLVKVTVAYPMTIHVPFSPQLALNLSSTSQMVISQ